jgi:hypothetical protein
MPRDLGAWSVRIQKARVQKAEAELATFCNGRIVPRNHNAPGNPFDNPRNGGMLPRNTDLVPGNVLAPGKGAIVPGNRLMVPGNSFCWRIVYDVPTKVVITAIEATITVQQTCRRLSRRLSRRFMAVS